MRATPGVNSTLPLLPRPTLEEIELDRDDFLNAPEVRVASQQRVACIGGSETDREVDERGLVILSRKKEPVLGDPLPERNGIGQPDQAAEELFQEIELLSGRDPGKNLRGDRAPSGPFADSDFILTGHYSSPDSRKETAPAVPTTK